MNVLVADEQSEPVDLAGVRRLAELVLGEEKCPSGTEVSVILVGDDEMAGYNSRFLGGNGPTDVISLPIEELAPTRPPGHTGIEGPPLLLGDVIVDPAYVGRHCADMGDDFDEQMRLMVVHGLLHLLGYDHDSDADAELMEGRERHLLSLAGMTRS